MSSQEDPCPPTIEQLIPPSERDELTLQRYIEAHATLDAEALKRLLSTDVVLTMETENVVYVGRKAVSEFFAIDAFREARPGDYHLVPTIARGRLAAANYIRSSTADRVPRRAVSLDLLCIVDGLIRGITVVGASEFEGLGLPDVVA